MWKKRRKKLWLLLPTLFFLSLGAPMGDAALETGGGGAVTLPEDGPPLVAITFDDGPQGRTTARLLDGLALREVQATFFLVGNRLDCNEELVRRMAAEGHQIGIHSFDHVCLCDLSRRDFNRQVGRTGEKLTDILGSGTFWLRPPYGILDDSVKKWACCPIVLWSVDPEDWKDKNSQRIVDAVLSQTRDGSIILLHDIYDTSVDAALAIVDALSAQGYCFLTVEQLLQAKGVTPAPGQSYTCVR